VNLGLKRIEPVSFNYGLSEITEKILELLEPNSNAKLLDLGCGNGENTLKYAAKIGTKNIYGIEVIEEYARMARSKGIHTYVVDLNEKWPIESKEFDVITTNQVIEHLWNIRLFVSECFRVLKSRGYAVIATENQQAGLTYFPYFSVINRFQLLTFAAIAWETF